jgi:hypothetical protein
MSQLKNRLLKIEAGGPRPGHERITAIHRVIVNADRTPALKADGTPWIIVRTLLE